MWHVGVAGYGAWVRQGVAYRCGRVWHMYVWQGVAHAVCGRVWHMGVARSQFLKNFRDSNEIDIFYFDTISYSPFPD